MADDAPNAGLAEAASAARVALAEVEKLLLERLSYGGAGPVPSPLVLASVKVAVAAMEALETTVAKPEPKMATREIAEPAGSGRETGAAAPKSPFGGGSAGYAGLVGTALQRAARERAEREEAEAERARAEAVRMQLEGATLGKTDDEPPLSVTFSSDVITDAAEGQTPVRDTFTFSGAETHHARLPSGRAASWQQRADAAGPEASDVASGQRVVTAVPATSPGLATAAGPATAQPRATAARRADPSPTLRVITGGAAELQEALNVLPEGAVALVHWRANWVDASLAIDAELPGVASGGHFAAGFRVDVEATLENRALAFEKAVELPASRRVGARPVPRRGARWPVVSVHVAPGLHPVGICHGEDCLVDAVEIAKGWLPEDVDERDPAGRPDLEAEPTAGSEVAGGAGDPPAALASVTDQPATSSPAPDLPPHPAPGGAIPPRVLPPAREPSLEQPPRRAVTGGAADFRDALRTSQPGPAVLVLWHKSSDEGAELALELHAWRVALAARPLLTLAADERHSANAALAGALRVKTLPALHAYRGLTRVGAWAAKAKVESADLDTVGVPVWEGSDQVPRVWLQGTAGAGAGSVESAAVPDAKTQAVQAAEAAAAASGRPGPSGGAATSAVAAADEDSAESEEEETAPGGEEEEEEEDDEAPEDGDDDGEDDDDSEDRDNGSPPVPLPDHEDSTPAEEIVHITPSGEVQDPSGGGGGGSGGGAGGSAAGAPSGEIARLASSEDPFAPPPGKYARKAATKSLPDGHLVHFFPRMPCLRCGCPWWTSDDWNGRCLRCGWDCESGGYDDNSQPLLKWQKRWEEYVEQIKQGTTPKYVKKKAAGKTIAIGKAYPGA